MSPVKHTAYSTYTWTFTHTHTEGLTREGVYSIGSLVSVLCGNSVGQVMEQGVMMHQQHQPWVASPAEVADGTHDWRGAIHSHKHTLTHTHSNTPICTNYIHKIGIYREYAVNIN